MSSFTVETRYRIYHDTEGDFFEVGPDVDGLNMVRISSKSEYFGVFDLTFESEVALLLADLLTKAANNAIAQDKIDFPEKT